MVIEGLVDVVESDDENIGKNVESSISHQPRCYFDVEVGGVHLGRIVFQLFWETAPKTCENFRSLVVGDKGVGKTTGKALSFKNTVFHRVIKDFMIQGGDFSKGNGTGGESIYGGTFEDENFEMKHDEPFLLSMANRGPATNGSQFFILTQPAPHLNNIHVVFGRVVSGSEIVRQIEALPVDRKNRPLEDVKISNCGELVLVKKKKEKKVKKAKKERKELSEEGEADSSDEEDSKKNRDEEEKSPERFIENPFLPKVRDISGDEIPKDPLNRLNRLPKKEEESESEDEKKSKEKKKKKRSRSRSRDKSSKNNEKEDVRRREERERRHADQRPNERRRGDGRYNFTYQRSTAFGRFGNSYGGGGPKIKGRGRVCYRPESRSRSRSITPPHWRAETRKTITLKEFEEKSRARKEREEMLRKRIEEREKRHKEQVEEENKKKLERERESEAIKLNSSGSNFERSEIEGSVVSYQHLFPKRNTTETHAKDGESVGLFANPGEEEEQRLRNELLKKRLKAWEESSDEEFKIKTKKKSKKHDRK